MSVSYIFYISGVDVSVSCQMSVSESMLHSYQLRIGMFVQELEFTVILNEALIIV